MDARPAAHEGEAAGETPLFSFGVLADVQYADIDNKQNFEKTAWRYYRESINVLKRAVDKWNCAVHPVSFVLQLGDLIDGFNTLSNSSQEALHNTLHVLSHFKGPGGVHHTWGNHEFYNFDRETLLSSPLNSNPAAQPDCSYYSFCPRTGFRVVVLDTYDVALIGYREDAPQYKEALSHIQLYNKNRDLNSPTGLRGMERRFCKFNGGVSERQLTWLDETLTLADEQREQVIVMGHIAVCGQSSSPICLLWNYDKVLGIFHRHDCVRAYLAGHDHEGGYAVDEHGIHHVTLRGVVEAAEDEDPTVTGHVYKHRLELHNLGHRFSPIDKVVIEL